MRTRAFSRAPHAAAGEDGGGDIERRLSRVERELSLPAAGTIVAVLLA